MTSELKHHLKLHRTFLTYWPWLKVRVPITWKWEKRFYREWQGREVISLQDNDEHLSHAQTKICTWKSCHSKESTVTKEQKQSSVIPNFMQAHCPRQGFPLWALEREALMQIPNVISTFSMSSRSPILHVHPQFDIESQSLHVGSQSNIDCQREF